MFFSKIISFISHASTDLSEYIALVRQAGNIHHHIKVKKTTTSGLNHYTITLKVKKHQFEDDVYSANPGLLDLVPRAYTIITVASGDEETLVSFVTGPRKFSGKTAADEDAEDENNTYKETGIYDHNKVLSWAKDSNLQIRSSVKANGKFALVRIFQYNATDYLTFGSKNYHLTIPLASLDAWVADDAGNNTPENAIVYSIAVDIHNNIDKIYTLLPIFSSGYTLCGELCDGQHFVLGDNSIEWFGFFRFGECLDTTCTKELLDGASLQTVGSDVVFHPGDPMENIDTVIDRARCVDNEGAVLYFENTVTGETILCKTKSIRYILMRMLRQAILNRGYMGIDMFTKRIVDASDYHGLHTDAATRIAKQLIRFVFWLMEHKIPTNVLGVIPVVAVRGKLPTGFAIWWNQYLSTTNTNDVVVTPEDFGTFEPHTFQENMDIYLKTDLRTNGDPCYLIFTQDLQGGGKSTIAASIQGDDPIGDSFAMDTSQFPIYLVPGKFSTDMDTPDEILTNAKLEYVEQDIFYGHSNSCLSWIYYKVLYGTGPQVIFVSRCNANEKHYKKYVDILAKLPTMIYFIAPKRMDCVSVITSMAGVMERSTKGDKLMVGRQEYDIHEVLEIISETYKNFKVNRNAIRYNKFCDIPDGIFEQMETAFQSKKILEYLTANLDRILDLRRPIQDIVAEVKGIVHKIRVGDYLERVYYNPRPTYVGLCVMPEDAARLRVETDIPGTHYNHHLTQFYHGKGKKWKPATFDTVLHGVVVDVLVTHRVTQKSTGAMAYRVDLGSIPCSNQTPHITSFMPIGMRPVEANQFVGLNDATVTVDTLQEPMTIRLLSKWF
ncbi:MAG: hypothetical protein AAF518_09820 [Spirochaetota bacterium]